MWTVADYLQRADALPPAPRILTELLPLLKNEQADSARIVALITFDAVLTARILRRCNSVQSGAVTRVHDLGEALMRLGFDEIYRLVALEVGRGMLGTAQNGYGMAVGDLWRHSVAAALACKVLARTLDGDENIVFTGGLLHDIGKLLLNTSLARDYQTVLGQIRQSGCSFLEAERDVLGVDHAELGARMLQRWNFPDALASAVEHHHNPLQAGPNLQLAAYLHVGDMVAHIMGQSEGFLAYAVRSCPEALQALEISPKEIENVVLKTESALKEADCYSRVIPAA